MGPKREGSKAVRDLYSLFTIFAPTPSLFIALGLPLGSGPSGPGPRPVLYLIPANGLPLETFTDMINTVNDATLWGLPKRTVKLSNVSWSRVLYGTCAFYFTVTYDFDIDFETFDRTIIDEGTRVLTKGGDKDNKNDFEVYKDVNGENTRVFLDGAGSALGDGADPVEIEIEYYKESNFLTLGIPSTLSC